MLDRKCVQNSKPLLKMNLFQVKVCNVTKIGNRQSLLGKIYFSSMYVCVCVCVCVSLFLSLSLALSVSMSLCLSLPLSVSVYVCVYLCVCVSFLLKGFLLSRMILETYPKEKAEDTILWILM